MTAYKRELKQSTAYDPTTYDGDGFDEIDPGMEGDDADYSRGGLLRGTKRIAFNDLKNPKWFIAQGGQPIPANAKLVVYRIKRAIVKWGRDPLTGKGILLEQREVLPGVKWPNIDKMNENIPKSEWRPSIFKKGELDPPWERQHIIYFIDMGSVQFDTYSWPTNVLRVGASICVEWIWGKIRDVRGIHGPGVKPEVELTDTFMPTQYAGPGGGRQRPDMKILKWIMPRNPQPALLTRKEPPLIEGKAQQVQTPANENQSEQQNTPQSADLPQGVEVVDEPTLSEILNDDIPYK